MIKRITQLLLLLQLLAAAAVFAALRHYFPLDGMGTAFELAASVSSIVLIRLLITLNNFVIAARFSSATPEQFHIGAWQACTMFAGEFKATMLSSSWTMPFQTFSLHLAPESTELPVLLIHGYGCNSGYWHSMSNALQRARISHSAIDLEPVIGGIDEYVPQISEAVNHLCDESGSDRVIIVAHSMGGLAARAYLRAHGSRKVALVITLGTPHHGTALAHFGVGLNTRQMRWTVDEQEGTSSEWLRQLARDEDPQVYGLFVSIYSHHDNIISPQTSSHLPHAKNVELHAIGHVALALDPVVQAYVIREIRESSSMNQRNSRYPGESRRGALLPTGDARRSP